MEALSTPLNTAQLELLKLFSRIKSEEELNAIKTMVSRYLMDKAITEADRLWEERGYTQQTMDDWMKEPT